MNSIPKRVSDMFNKAEIIFNSIKDNWWKVFKIDMNKCSVTKFGIHSIMKDEQGNEFSVIICDRKLTCCEMSEIAYDKSKDGIVEGVG